MRENLRQARVWTIQHEGGYVNHPKDPGGATNYGVTQRAYDRYRDAVKKPRQSVKYITPVEVEHIYNTDYWTKVRADDLPPGWDYAFTDFYYHSGDDAVKVFQRMFGLKDDGIMGPKTMAQVQKCDLHDLSAYFDERLSYLQTLRVWPTFGKGWTRRCAEARVNALSLAKGTVHGT